MSPQTRQEAASLWAGPWRGAPRPRAPLRAARGPQLRATERVRASVLPPSALTTERAPGEGAADTLTPAGETLSAPGTVPRCVRVVRGRDAATARSARSLQLLGRGTRLPRQRNRAEVPYILVKNWVNRHTKSRIKQKHRRP